MFKQFTILAAMITGLMFIVFAFSTVYSMVTGTVNSGIRVMKQELSPEALNQKYEWFKNAYAALDSKRSTIKGFEADVLSYEKDFGVDRSKWSRDTISNYNLSRSEYRGIVASYNGLAADYNAEMAKWHTNFVNAGRLPAGGNGEIPREVAVYIEK